ncbi:MAG: hypothetical protein WED09_05055 [Homoserinimonas sp.]
MTEQSPYAAPSPAQQPFQAALKKPPLSRELKRAAFIAGAVSFTVMTIGWGLFSTAAGIGLFAGFFAWVLGLISASGEGRDADFFRLMELIDTINPAAWVIPLVIAGVVGAALWACSLYISRGILARAKHPSPWAVTWAGAGIAVAASWFVSWIAWLPMQFGSVIAADAFTTVEGGLAITIALVIVSLLLNVVIAAAVGLFAWWWMAHAMRPAAQPVTPPR